MKFTFDFSYLSRELLDKFRFGQTEESPKMTYEQQCEYGREIAASAVAECLETGNQPKLVRMIRDMASQETGVSIGFLHSIAERVAK